MKTREPLNYAAPLAELATSLYRRVILHCYIRANGTPREDRWYKGTGDWPLSLFPTCVGNFAKNSERMESEFVAHPVKSFFRELYYAFMPNWFVSARAYGRDHNSWNRFEKVAIARRITIIGARLYVKQNGVTPN